MKKIKYFILRFYYTKFTNRTVEITSTAMELGETYFTVPNKIKLKNLGRGIMLFI